MTNPLASYGLVPFFTQQLADSPDALNRLGRVLAVQRSRSSVVCAAGERAVELTTSLRDSPALERPTVGDWVTLDGTLSRVESVLERRSLFKRLAAGDKTEEQPIAANIDTLFIVSSCNDEFSESRLERYLSLCVQAEVDPVIVLTKADLATSPDAFVQRARRLHASVPVEIVDSRDPASIAGMRAWIGRQSTVALVGSSGVGKSTLLNTLAGTDLAATQDIREQDKKGRHTTTHRELHRLPSGGLVIDVPGMRELRVAGIETSLATVFDDIESLSMRCRFHDCEHEREPGCAVLRAVEDGTLDERRLVSFRKLQRESAAATATLAEKRAQGRDLARIVKEAKAVKKHKGTT